MESVGDGVGVGQLSSRVGGSRQRLKGDGSHEDARLPATFRAEAVPPVAGGFIYYVLGTFCFLYA